MSTYLQTMISHKKGLLALSPLLVFILLYLVTSIIVRDFYKVPITVAFLISSIYAIMISYGFPLQKRILHFSRGASTNNLLLMLWIFVMAGAFANSAEQMGCIDATVNLSLSILPAQMLLGGLFLSACFISLSIGTSVGTIIALVPIAAGIAQSTGASVPMLTAVVVGGAFFGDNLSFISDTTIAATTTQGCKLSDKFRVNFFLVAPAACLILALYLYIGKDLTSTQETQTVEYIRVIPYLIVLVMAVLGMNVMAVLTVGIIMTGFIGVLTGAYDVFGWFGAMGDGIKSMGELIIITMMAGGLLEIVRMNGGIDYILEHVSSHVNSKREAEAVIATLVSLTNVCTANNTVSIITVGGIAKQIGDRFGVDNRKCASILDTFSCFVQGLLPYGAQLLMAAGLASINPVRIIPFLYYPMAIGVSASLSIIFRLPKRYR